MELFFELIQVAIGGKCELSRVPTADGGCRSLPSVSLVVAIIISDVRLLCCLWNGLKAVGLWLMAEDRRK